MCCYSFSSSTWASTVCWFIAGCMSPTHIFYLQSFRRLVGWSPASYGLVGSEKKAKSDFVKCVRICLIIPQVTVKSRISAAFPLCISVSLSIMMTIAVSWRWDALRYSNRRSRRRTELITGCGLLLFIWKLIPPKIHAPTLSAFFPSKEHRRCDADEIVWVTSSSSLDVEFYRPNFVLMDGYFARDYYYYNSHPDGGRAVALWGLCS